MGSKWNAAPPHKKIATVVNSVATGRRINGPDKLPEKLKPYALSVATDLSRHLLVVPDAEPLGFSRVRV
jgi:hypothetical protein